MSNDFRYEYTDPQELIKNIGLCDVGDAKPIVAEASVTGIINPTFCDYKFSIISGIDFKIEAFNSPDDVDSDKVFGQPDPEGFVHNEFGLQPTFVYDPEKAWLKYSALASLSTDTSTTVDNIGFGLDTKHEVILADYRGHDSRESTNHAITRDLPPKSVLSKKDITSLRPDDALLYSFRGKVSGKLTLSWSDVFTGSLNSLSHLLKKVDLMAIRTEVGASVELNTRIEDDFVAVLSSAGNDRLRLAVKKAKLRERSAGAKVGIKVEFADKEKVKAMLIDGILAIAGSSIDKINDLFETMDPDKLDNNLRALLEQFGLGTYLNDLKKIKQKWEQLVENIFKEAQAAAETRLEIGFKCSYQKISMNEAILQITLPKADIEDIHTEMLLCDLRSILTFADSNPVKIVIERYMQKKTIKNSFSWGFTIGLGSYGLGGKDIKKTTWIKRKTRRDNHTEEKCSFSGTRSYTAPFFNESSGWMVDFMADMDSYAKNPTSDKYRYGLSIAWFLSDKDVDDAELHEYLDYAIIYRAINVSSRNRISDILHTHKIALNKMNMTVELRFTHDQLFKMLNVPKSIWKTLMIQSMANAMPVYDAIPMRWNPTEREKFYTPFWKKYLNDKKCSFYELVNYGTSEVKCLHEQYGISPTVYGIKKRVYKNINSFAGQIYSNGKDQSNMSGLVKDWELFEYALGQLRDVMGSQLGAYRLDEIFRDLCVYFNQYLKVRAIGIFLLKLADAANIKQEDISSTLTFKDNKFSHLFRQLR